MDRGRKAIPVQNKACMERYILRCQDRHKQKLRDMKCTIDNKCPKQSLQLKSKAKKNALVEERIVQIETENRILLDKMSHIWRTKGGIDNKNESVKYSHSLSKERRLRELKSISHQNHQIHRRIMNSRPTYNHKVWEEQAKLNEKILSNISEFRPHKCNESRPVTISEGMDILDEDLDF